MSTLPGIPPALENKAADARGGGRVKGEPPKWAVEVFFEKLAVVPAAAGKALDRAATVPVLGWVVKFFSSIIMGLVWLGLVGAYIAVGSGFASVRAKFEMTDMEFFNAWPMVVLMLLLSVTLTVVTLRRIRLSVFKAGVWTVHVGIITLITGCFLYFSQKTEGLVRIHLNESVSSYYDATERALYAFPMGEGNVPLREKEAMAPLPKLPIYFEHLPEDGKGLSRDVPLANLPNTRVRILGYYPAAELRETWTLPPAASGMDGKLGEKTAEQMGELNPAIRISLTVEGQDGGQVLLANSPKGRVLDAPSAPFGIEYLRNPSAERLAEITREVPGPVAITVRVPSLKVEKTFAAEPNKPVAVEGTPYTVTPKDQMALPLVSKGYEGAFSNALSMEVTRAGGAASQPATNPSSPPTAAATQPNPFVFTRMAVFRYPELSPDFITENGKQKRIQARVDQSIDITFHDAQRDQFYLVQSGSDSAPNFELIHRVRGGKVERSPLKIGTPLQVQVGPVPLKISLRDYSPTAVLGAEPLIVPLSMRPQSAMVGEVIQTSMVRLQVKHGAFERDDIYVPYVQFASTAPTPFGRPPTVVDVPGLGKIGFVFSTTRRELPSELKLNNFQAIKYPGAMQSYADYVSTLEATDKVTREKEPLVAQLNKPASNHGLYYFQAAWDGDRMPGVRFTVLGVGNRPGIMTMTVGSILIILGIAYAFYVKPILLRMKKEQVAAWARANA